MIRLVPARRSCPVFLIFGPKGVVPLTKRTFVFAFRSYLVTAGISNAQSFRDHSFRRGAASWAFRCGVPGEIIQLYGDWSSDAYKLYLEFSLECKLTLANQLRQAIIHVLSSYFSPFFLSFLDTVGFWPGFWWQRGLFLLIFPDLYFVSSDVEINFSLGQKQTVLLMC